MANAINAMYNLTLIREDVIDIGIHIIRNELEFNEHAGITQEMNDVPKFFREETSEPVDLKFTFSQDELKSFWNRLDKHQF